jgi:hypothetical protein
MLLDDVNNSIEFLEFIFGTILFEFLEFFLVNVLILITENFSFFSLDHVFKQASHSLSIVKQSDSLFNGIVRKILLHL